MNLSSTLGDPSLRRILDDNVPTSSQTKTGVSGR
jgi:hypothetical protein